MKRKNNVLYYGTSSCDFFRPSSLQNQMDSVVAMVNNLPECHRIKPNGKNLIVQKCASLNISVSAKPTKCGTREQKLYHWIRWFFIKSFPEQREKR
jgi:hypothetical protein